MSSDDSTRGEAITRSNAGSGHYIAFMCPLCNKRKDRAGCRKQRVMGLAQMVCAACARPKQ